jgi:hypothetical protein
MTCQDLTDLISLYLLERFDDISGLNLFQCNVLCRSLSIFTNITLNDLVLTLGEEHWLRVSENRVMKGVFGRKRDEVTEAIAR